MSPSRGAMVLGLLVAAVILAMGCTSPPPFQPRAFGDCMGNGECVETSYEEPGVVIFERSGCWCTAEYSAACPADCDGCGLGVSG